MAKAKNEVAETSKKSVALVNDLNLMEDKGAGSETMSADELAIPRISILQALSPQTQKKTEKYVEGAEAGSFWNSVEELPMDGDEGFLFVPVSYRQTVIEWGLRENGGGFINDHGNNPQLTKECEIDDKNRRINADGNQLVLTAEYYVLIVDAKKDSWTPAVISMSASQLKKSRVLNTKIKQLLVTNADGEKFNPAMFYSQFHATTVPESRDDNQWMGWKIMRDCDTLKIGLEDGAESDEITAFGKEVYLAAREFNAQIEKGSVKVHTPKDDTGETEEDDNAPM